MIRKLKGEIKYGDKNVLFILIFCVLVVVLLNLAQDLLRATFRNSAFYFSEAFLFSSFWWIFAPLFFAQYLFARQKMKQGVIYQCLVTALPVLIHIFLFPLIVWLLSRFFYYHTYAFQQTLNYTLSEYLYILILFYSVPILSYRFYTGTLKTKVTPAKDREHDGTPFIEAIAVSDGNKKLSVPVSEIFYFSANPPYINIHLEDNKYLHAETLKSASLKLNPEQFLRIHKSTIVNINCVASYKTRLNGDYDLIMKNNIKLRVSRYFAADFKSLFNSTHRLTIK